MADYYVNDKSTAIVDQQFLKLLGIQESLLDHVDESGELNPIRLTDYTNKDVETALHLASENGHTAMVKALLEHGVDVNTNNNFFRYTPLHRACLNHNDAYMVELFLKFGAEKEQKALYKGSTALHVAAERGHSAMVYVLLKHGANPNASNDDRDTPLHNACFCHNNASLVEVLLQFGAKTERKNLDGCTALHMAAQRGHNKVINVLLKYIANIDAQDDEGNTPLHQATKMNWQELVVNLLQKGADKSVRNSRRRTPLDEATVKKYTNLVKVLANSADVMNNL